MSFHRFAKTLGEARMKPVPRSLSSSCGTCVCFSCAEALRPEDYAGWQVECLYAQDGNNYTLLLENE